MTVAECSHMKRSDTNGDVRQTLALVERLEAALRGLGRTPLITRDELAQGVGDVTAIRSRLMKLLHSSPDDPCVLSIAA